MKKYEEALFLSVMATAIGFSIFGFITGHMIAVAHYAILYGVNW